MSTMKIQDLNYDESTAVTLEPSEAESVLGGFFRPGGGGFQSVNPNLGGALADS